MDPLRETLKVTRLQYQAELLTKRDEMAGNKRKFGGNNFIGINPHRLSDLSLVRVASFSKQVIARQLARGQRNKNGRRGGTPFLLSFQLSWRTRVETLATIINLSRSPSVRRVKRNKEVNNLVFWNIEYEVSSKLRDKNLNIKRIVAVINATYVVAKGTA